ncbi:MAG: hypothetical protein J7501_04235, partial [Bdellovibrio sp.]|nr:hypothetical protein [Bdellovibrio sp.]
MKAIGLILFGALALGCAHSDNQTSNDKLPTKIPHIHPGYVYLTKEDRAPAEAPVLKWRPATASLEVTSDAARGTKQVEVNQEMIWKELEYYNDTRMEYQEIDVLGSCSDFVCSKASGQSAAWDKYFAAPRERKAAALNEAIQGIGEVSATNLVAKGYFRAKPNSWTEFSDVLK